jgi:hypothetical protein
MSFRRYTRCGLWGVGLAVALLVSSCSGRPLRDSDELLGSGLLQGGSFTFNVPLPPGTPMSAVALGSNSSILVGDRVTVGVEGAASARATIANSGTGNVSISADARLTGDVWSRGNVTFIGERGQVAGSITTAGTVTRQNGVVIGGPVLEHQTLSTVPTSWTITFPSSSTNVVLQPGQTQTLGPGAYATVSVASNATLTLATGTYYFDQLTNEPQGKILLTGTGPFLLYVRTKLVAKGPVVPPAASAPPPLLVGFAGTMDVFIQTDLDGTIAAPNANVTLAPIGPGIYQGAYFGKSLTLQADVKVERRGIGVGDVVPVAECVVPQANGSYKAVFGYFSSSLTGNISIPIGPGNTFDKAPIGRGQPQVFLPGRQRAQFVVPFDGKALAWVVNGRATTATAILPTCTATCVQHLVDPSKPRITTPLTTGAPPLSVDESWVMRDSFRWKDTLPVPEAFADGNPRMYYGLVYLESRAAVQALDLFRIHYQNAPLFEQEMSLLEQQGVAGTFSYSGDGQGQWVYALVPGGVYNAIRQAALDPAEPLELFRAFLIRPIPQSDLGLAPRASCGLQPVTQCVAQAANGSLRAVFSYTNPAGNPVTVPVGVDNSLTGGAAGVAPPEAFAAGAHTAVFAVGIPTGATVRWTLNGQTASASAATPRCSAAMVAQIGADVYKPFPTPPTPSCRYATPAEVRSPTSQLPAAARVNTCVTTSYQYLATLGFKWRGVDDDANDADAHAAEAAFSLGQGAAAATTSTSDGHNQVVQSALFGKIFRRVGMAVLGTGRELVDFGRRGLRAFTGLFLGTTDVHVTIEPMLMDPSFAPGVMRQAWGARYNEPMSLEGIQLRAIRGPFLSVVDLDGNNHGKVVVVNHLSGARVCFRARSHTGSVTAGFISNEFCPPMLPTLGSQGSVTVRVGHPELNVMAQMTDARRYMTTVGRSTPEDAVVAVGWLPDMVGRMQALAGPEHRDRAFTPCLNFSWRNPVELFVALITQRAASGINEWTVATIRGGVTSAGGSVSGAMGRYTEVTTVSRAINTELMGTQHAQQAAAMSALVEDARIKLELAKNSATVLAQDTEDFVQATGTASRLVSQNDPAAPAATRVVQQTSDALNAQVASTRDSAQAAQTAVGIARASVNALAASLAASGDPDHAATLAALDGVFTAVTDGLVMGLMFVGQAATEIAGVAVAGVAGLVVAAGLTVIGNVAEFFAGGDIIMPSSGGPRNLLDRSVATHEYGHFILCNLLLNVSPVKFAYTYDEAAVQGFLSLQDPSATGAVVNEAFADLITSQVAGGTNYASPAVSFPSTGGTSYCDATGRDCIEANVNNAITPSTFPNRVLHYVSLFVDAFDAPGTFGDAPSNGNPWTRPMGLLQLSAVPGLENGDEVVTLRNQTVPTSWFTAWMGHATRRGDLLREDNVFAGLSDTMINHGYNWCERCEVFRLHTVGPMIDPMTMMPIANCPERWVGDRPMFSLDGGMTTQTLACVFDGCPAGTTINNATRTCDPPCPANHRFDPFTLGCVPTIPDPG